MHSLIDTSHIIFSMRILTVLLFICSFTLPALAQSEVMDKDQGAWNTLSMVTFERTFDPEFGIDIEKPNVSPLVTAMGGKEVILEGYIIPLTGKIKQSHFMLSKFPQNMCFFCGKAGPESAAQVFTKDAIKVAYTSEKIKVKGTLRINITDATNLLYTIEDGIVID